MDDYNDIRASVIRICSQFPNSYWRELDKTKGFPDEFIKVLNEEGFLSVLIPEEYGGVGLGVSAAGVILEEISRSGGHPGAFHAQMYTMGTLLRHGSDAQKSNYLNKIASGELRLQAFGVTEPTAGTDTTAITTFATKTDDGYVVNGQKVWISRAQHSDLMLLLARTKPVSEATKKTDGLSVFLIDLKRNVEGLTITPIDSMINHHSTEIFFDNYKIPLDSLIGEEHNGFRYILDGMNAERILIAYECIGDGKFFIEKATNYANERVVFNRKIGQNQGIQFPIAEAYANLQAAELMTHKASELFDQGLPCAKEANIAKYLAAKASWEAANACMQTFGGYSFAREYDVERKFRETRLYQVAPISTNLILSYIGEHVLKMPRSF